METANLGICAGDWRHTSAAGMELG